MATITQENVRFNGELDNAYVLNVTGGVRTLVVADKLSAADRARLVSFIDQYGSNPLSAPTAASLDIKLGSAVTGTTPTGLSSVATPTSGVTTMTILPVATELGATGIPAQFDTKGAHDILIAPFDWYDPIPGIVTGTSATYGKQEVTFTEKPWSGDPTGLANDTTEYTFTVAVDGGAPTTITIVGSDAQTYQDLADAVGLQTADAFTFDIGWDDYWRFESNTSGATSSILVTDVDLFSSLTAPGLTLNAPVPGAAAIPSGDYTITMQVNGVTTTQTVSGGDLTSWFDLVAVRNLFGNTFTINIDYTNNNRIMFRTWNAGDGNTIRIVGGTLIDTIQRAGGILSFPQPGRTNVQAYNATFVIDGIHYIHHKFTNSAEFATFGALVTKLNTVLDGYATAFLSNGNLVIQSDTTGASSSVVVVDTDSFFRKITNFKGFVVTPGVEPTTYTATFDLNGTPYVVSDTGDNLATVGDVIAAVDTAFDGDATATISGGVITVVTTDASGTLRLTLTQDDLFKRLPGYTGTSQLAGAVDLVSEMRKVRIGAGSLYDTFEIVQVGNKPPVPPVPETLPKTAAFTYYGGTPAAWRYLEDDTEV